jgi:hypothetical protein
MHTLVRLSGKNVAHLDDALDEVFGGDDGETFGDVAA